MSTDEAADPVDVFYQAADRLRSSVNIPSESSSYDVLVQSASSASEAAKQLAADSLPLYFHLFPSSADAALSAYFDLLEDPSASVRLHAIKGLETLAKQNPTLASRLADVLAQLLATEDAHEALAVRTALSALLGLHRRAAFTAVFAQLKEAEAGVKERIASHFLLPQLAKQWKAVTAAATSDEEQTEMANGLKAVLLSSEGLSEKDSRAFLQHLLQLRVVREDPNLPTDLGQLLASLARLDKEFMPSQEQSVDAFIGGLRALSSHKKYKVDATPFLHFFASKVLPQFDSLPAERRVSVLRAAAPLLSAADAKTTRAVLDAVWLLCKANLPATKASEEVKVDDASLAHFTLVETLLSLVHQLAAASPEAARDVLGLFASTGQPSDSRVEAAKKDSLARLSEAATHAGQWSAQLPAAVAEGRKRVKEETDEEEKKTVRRRLSRLEGGRRVADGVQQLVKALAGKNPAFLSDPPKSWRRGKEGKGKGKARDGEDKGKKTKQKEKTDGRQTGQGAAKKQRTDKDAAPSSRAPTDGGAGGAASASKKKRGRDQQTSAPPSSSAQQSGQAQGSGSNNKKRKSEASSQSQQSAPQRPGQSQSTKKRKTEGTATGGGGERGANGGRGGGQQLQHQAVAQALAAQQAAAAQAYMQMQLMSAYNPAAFAGIAAAQAQQQQQQQPQQQSGRRGGGKHKGGGGGGGGQPQQQQAQQSQSQKGGGGGGSRGQKQRQRG